MRIGKYIGLLLFVGVVSVYGAEAKPERTEVVALKNNLLYDAAATPNLQLEIRLNRKWSLELGAGFNPFPLDDTKFPKWRHVSAWIAPRYWFCQVFNRGFLSFNAAYAHYNVAGNAYPVAWMYKQVKDSRYQGDAVMAGISYGWHFAISPHFSIELEGGLEAGYSWYKQFECKHCGTLKDQGGRWLLLPKLGVNLSVPLGGDKESFARRCDCERLDDKGNGDGSEVIGDSVPEESPAKVSPLKSSRRIMPEPAKVMAVVPPFEPNIKEEHIRLRSRLAASPENLFVYFDVDIAKMDRSFIDNDKLMDSIMHILSAVTADTTLRVERIDIEGLASFDGRLGYNERLAGNRAQTIKKYIQSAYAFPDSIFAVTNGGESWIRLVEDLQDVEFEGKEEVLEIIEAEPDFDARERKIKALHDGKTYRYMRDHLRHIMRNLGCITIYIERK